jgi:RimJ/RimL family protein N-acetyltransferase
MAFAEFLRPPGAAWSPPSVLPVTPSARATVRAYGKGDGPALFSAVDADRASLLPWMAWVRTEHQDVDESIHFVETRRRVEAERGCTNFTLGVFDRDTGEVVGGTGLHDIRPGTAQAEVGWWIRGARSGQGLATEVAGAHISAALRPQSAGGWGLRRIVVEVHEPNVASLRVCEKLGLRQESRMRADRYLGPVGVDGARGWYDSRGFAVLADEWDFDLNRAKPGIGWD